MGITFRIGYRTQWGESLFLVWQGGRAAMQYQDSETWSVTIGNCPEGLLKDYWYVVEKDGIFSRMEWKHHSRKKPAGDAVFDDAWQDGPEVSNGFLRTLSSPVFDTRGYKGAGTAIPVFSLRSEDDFGIGEFLDLKKMVDWAVATGQDIIQLLPVNDTTRDGSRKDSYPYNAISSFALHPLYLNLKAAGLREDAAARKVRKALNSLDQVDYEAVYKAKMDLMRRLYAQIGAEVLDSKAFKAFRKANAEWLVPYAAFCALRDSFGTADFSKWEGFATYSARKVTAYCRTHPEETGFYLFIQFLLDVQMKEVREYAHSRGVSLKGDLPIGISRTSVDAWCFPELFNMDSQAGAPPDAFAKDGQNWGFPTYNWESMARDDYSWWKRRLGKMAELFDAFRIDHILGFFRIWEIPVPEESGLSGHFSPALPYSVADIWERSLPFKELFIADPRKEGLWHPAINGLETETFDSLMDWQKDRYRELYYDFFFHRHEDFWRRQALRKLPSLLASTSMMACGEDLGMVPGCVPGVMEALNILSLKIQRMPSEGTFGHPESYPYLCVCTTSTHDMNPVRAWWEEDSELTARYYREILGEDGETPQVCTPEICERIVKAHLKSPAMLVILPLQDWLSIDGDLRAEDPSSERINIPADPNHYWRYRMHITIEDLLGQKVFNERIKSLASLRKDLS